MRKSARVFMPSTAFRYTLPPRPPSPPSGPPKGTNFSRRKLTQPRPPLPACTLSLASSMNFISVCAQKSKRGQLLPCPLWFRASARERTVRRRELLRNDVDVGVLFATFDAEFDFAVRLCEQRVIGADADVHAGAVHRAALPDQNVAGQHVLTAELLDSQALGMRVTPVACTAACFFMCHLSASSVSLSDDRRDLHVGVRLPVRLLTLVMLAASEFDDPHLVALAMTLDRRNHLRAAHVGGANCHVRTGADEQHLIEFDTGTGLGIELFNAHDGTFLNAVLFTARGNHG